MSNHNDAEKQATAQQQRTPKLANDLSAPLSRLALADVDHLPGALEPLLARTPCKTCAKVGTLTAVAARVALVLRLDFECQSCRSSERVHCDELWGSRYAANYRFVYSGTVMAQSFSVLRAPLSLFGLSLPNETHSAFKSFRESLKRQVKLASEESMLKNRLAMRLAASRAALAHAAHAKPEIAVSIDGQYPTTQGAAIPKGAVSAMMDSKARKVVDVAFSHPKDPRTLAFKLKDAHEPSRTLPKLQLSRPSDAHVTKYDAVEYGQHEVRCALQLLERLLAWPDAGSAVTVVADEHVTVRALIEAIGFSYCLDVFHRVTKLTSDFTKFIQRKSLVAATSPRLSPAATASIAAQLRTAFKEAAKAPKGTKGAKFRMIVPNLRDLDHQNDVVAVQCVQEFVGQYASYLALTENVDQPYTSANEALHSHNLRLFSKRVYQPAMWETKCRCSILSWNEEPKWPSVVLKATLQDCLPDKVARKLSLD